MRGGGKRDSQGEHLSVQRGRKTPAQNVREDMPNKLTEGKKGYQMTGRSQAKEEREKKEPE